MQDAGRATSGEETAETGLLNPDGAGSRGLWVVRVSSGQRDGRRGRLRERWKMRLLPRLGRRDQKSGAAVQQKGSYTLARALDHTRMHARPHFYSLIANTHAWYCVNTAPYGGTTLPSTLHPGAVVHPTPPAAFLYHRLRARARARAPARVCVLGRTCVCPTQAFYLCVRTYPCAPDGAQQDPRT